GSARGWAEADRARLLSGLVAVAARALRGFAVAARALRGFARAGGRATAVAGGDDMPGELFAVEGVLESVAGDFTGPLLRERVEAHPVVGDLAGAVRALGDAQMGRNRAAHGSAAHRQRFPKGGAGAGAERHAGRLLLVVEIERLAARVHQDGARAA